MADLTDSNIVEPEGLTSAKVVRMQDVLGITSNVTNIATNASDIEVLETTTTDHETRITTNEDSIDNLEVIVTDHETRITTNETSLLGKKDRTGFNSQDDVTVNYDETTKQVTLTNVTGACYKGEVVSELIEGWVSTALPETSPTGGWFLYYTDTGFVFSQDLWAFEDIQIAYVFYDVSGNFIYASRETHGEEQSADSHEEFHSLFGTYVKTVPTLTGVTLDSTTEADRRPLIPQTELQDEDLATIVDALATNNYTLMTLTSAGDSTFLTDQADIFTSANSQSAYWNEFDGTDWVQTQFTNNQYGSIWVFAVPCSADATSQKSRFVFVQGQAAYSSSASAIDNIKGLSFTSLNLGDWGDASPEYNCIAHIVIKETGAGYWAVDEIIKQYVTRAGQGVQSGNFLSAVSSDSTYFDGAGTADDDLTFNATTATKIDNLPSDTSSEFDLKLDKDYSEYTEATLAVDGHLFNIWSTITNASVMINWSTIVSTMTSALSTIYTSLTSFNAHTADVSDGAHSENNYTDSEMATVDGNYTRSVTNQTDITALELDVSNLDDDKRDDDVYTFFDSARTSAQYIKIASISGTSDIVELTVTGSNNTFTTNSIYMTTIKATVSRSIADDAIILINGVKNDTIICNLRVLKIGTSDHEIWISSAAMVRIDIVASKNGTPISKDDYSVVTSLPTYDTLEYNYFSDGANGEFCFGDVVVNSLKSASSVCFDSDGLMTEGVAKLDEAFNNYDSTTGNQYLLFPCISGIASDTNNYINIGSLKTYLSADLVSSVSFSFSGATGSIVGRVSSDGILYFNGNMYNSSGFSTSTDYVTFDISSILSSDQEFNVACCNNNANSYYNTCGVEVYISSSGSSTIEVKQAVSSTYVYFNATIDLNALL